MTIMSRSCYFVLVAVVLVCLHCSSCLNGGPPKESPCCRDIATVLQRERHPNPDGDVSGIEVGVAPRFPPGSVSVTVTAKGGSHTKCYLSTDGGITWFEDRLYQHFYDALTGPDRRTIELFPSPFLQAMRYRRIRRNREAAFNERSSDGGVTWVRLQERVLGCEAVLAPSWGAIDYHPKESMTIYLQATMPGQPTWRKGMYVSHDAGDTFSFLFETDNFAGIFGEPIAVCASDPRIIYGAGINGSVLKSADAGQVWRLVGQNDEIRRPYFIEGEEATEHEAEKVEIESDEVIDLDVDPADPDTVYVTTGKGLLRSVDGGRSWCVLDLGMRMARGVNNLVVYLNDPNVLLAGTYNGLLRSTTKGCTWEPVNISERIAAKEPQVSKP